MGLHKVRKISAISKASAWLVAVCIAVICGIIGAGGNTARELLKFDRLAIAEGEWWRLVGGHFAHLGFSHLALNVAGLVLVWILVGSRLTAARWCVVIVIGIAAMDLGFWFIDTRLMWYVGLSGLLHTLLVAGAIAGYSRARGESLAILLIVLAKLAYEQLSGPLPGSELTSGGPVVVNAHLYGSIGGLLAGASMWHRVTRGRPI